MGLEDFRKKPAKITEAIKADDKEYLSNAGRKGAEKVNKDRDLKKSVRDEMELRHLQEDVELRRASNEHIISADGTDHDWNPESDNR